MGEGIPGLATAYEVLFTAALIFLALMLVFCLIRAIIGPRVADRLVAVNMMGTIVMVIIAILALMLQEGYLGDICLIYAMISFLAVVVLTKVYMGAYIEKENRAAAAASQEAVPAKAAVAAVADGKDGAVSADTAVVSGTREQGRNAASKAQGSRFGADNTSKKKSRKGKRRGNG